jgi:hypothetical protein
MSRTPGGVIALAVGSRSAAAAPEVALNSPRVRLAPYDMQEHGPLAHNATFSCGSFSSQSRGSNVIAQPLSRANVAAHTTARTQGKAPTFHSMIHACQEREAGLHVLTVAIMTFRNWKRKLAPVFPSSCCYSASSEAKCMPF